jgi:hypothetical protein
MIPTILLLLIAQAIEPTTSENARPVAVAQRSPAPRNALIGVEADIPMTLMVVNGKTLVDPADHRVRISRDLAPKDGSTVVP